MINRSSLLQHHNQSTELVFSFKARVSDKTKVVNKHDEKAYLNSHNNKNKTKPIEQLMYSCCLIMRIKDINVYKMNKHVEKFVMGIDHPLFRPFRRDKPITNFHHTCQRHNSFTTISKNLYEQAYVQDNWIVKNNST